VRCEVTVLKRSGFVSFQAKGVQNKRKSPRLPPRKMLKSGTNWNPEPFRKKALLFSRQLVLNVLEKWWIRARLTDKPVFSKIGI